ncbi:SDR family oxidoreductase [Actinotalea sp. BY-33]|uniref:SDR family oxidoreductase n=1 Tax=Actinotalea soli TaxID=2819234 RepID=A0A939LRA6_9CELL|nr:SDR family NAD(P)-dependent oxidoreductase [Actinotalea soli]MBO1752388.1 SDR family oxidoreductase [Actinotalea soli]
MARLDGMVVIVTGGARGMGAEDCRRLVSEGAQVVIGDVLDAEGQALDAELGDAAIFVHLDVASASSWAAAVEAAHEAYGTVTGLVNNAGVLSFSPVDTAEEADVTRLLQVNLTGAFLGIQAVVEDMKAAGGGSIVNISSAAGLVGMAGLAAYASSKWGMRGLTKCAALDLGRYGIRVSSIHPGGIRTPMAAGVDDAMFATQAIPRIGEVGEIASVVAFLLSEEASYITGAELAVDGGMVLGPLAPEPV